MTFIVNIGIGFLNFIYFFMKLLPVKKKITYISRQMDSIPVDFAMVRDQFMKDDPTYEHVILAKMIHEGITAKIGYCFHMLRQMYHIATSEAVILDTYCIPVSILKQRQSLVVIQMWHALGAFKKFGYSILDQKEGSSSKTAKLMHMHENYTYALTSSQAALPHFAEAFHMKEEDMRIYPLPKTDLLVDESYRKKIIARIDQAYPDLASADKKILVYAPTFRKTDDHLQSAIKKLIDAIDFDRYILVLKLHPLTELKIDDPRIIVDEQFSSLEFFNKADAIITDYSAVIFEASLLDKPLYFYAFDYDTYIRNRSFYIDYQKTMPGPIRKDAAELMSCIDQEMGDQQKVAEFASWMIAPYKKSYTKDFCEFLHSQLV